MLVSGEMAAPGRGLPPQPPSLPRSSQARSGGHFQPTLLQEFGEPGVTGGGLSEGADAIARSPLGFELQINDKLEF